MIRTRTRTRDSGAEALMDPRTVIQPGTNRQPAGVVEFATTETNEAGGVTVIAHIAGRNTLISAGVRLNYANDGAVTATQVPLTEGGVYTEFRVSADGTALPAYYHGPYGIEVI